MSQSISIFEALYLILTVPPRLFLILLGVSTSQLLGKIPTGTWSQNVGEALTIWYAAYCTRGPDDRLMNDSVGTFVPLSVIRSILRPSSSVICGSTRYSILGDQILTHVKQSTFEGYWICRGLKQAPIDPKDADVVIFHLHGGGYAIGHPFLEAPNLLFVTECLARKGLTTAIFAVRYTLTPEGQFPQQTNETASAYSWLVQHLGISPSRIALIGESAGGHLALSFLLDLHLKSKQVTSTTSDVEKPGSAFFISPWCDLHNSNPKAINLRPGEVGFKQVLTKWGNFALGNLDASQRALFLNYAQKDSRRGSWKDILPWSTWISAGDDETLFVHDIIDLVSAARDDGANVTLEIEPGGRHAWQTGVARPHHAAFLDSELGTDCAGLTTAWKSLIAAIIDTVEVPPPVAHT